MTRKYSFEDYSFKIAPLSAEDGGGFLITFPDLPGCMSDGESVEEAITNGRDAFEQWAAVQHDENRAMPVPGASADAARFVQRLPRYLHHKLTDAARQEGVSINTLVTTFVAEGLVGRESVLTVSEPPSASPRSQVETLSGTILPDAAGDGYVIDEVTIVQGKNVVVFPKRKVGQASITAASSLTPLYGELPLGTEEK
jgi:antitoxin HicB